MKKLSTLIASFVFIIAANAQTYSGTIAPNPPQRGQTIVVSFSLQTGAPQAGLSIYVDNGGVVTQLATTSVFGNLAYNANYTIPANQPTPSAINFAVGNGVTFYGIVSTVTVLPVVFIDNSAKYIPADNKVVLSWKIATTDGVKEFNILRSTDGRNFTKVGTVKPTSATDYTYEDVLPAASADGIYYFKISGVSQDGAIKETGSVAIKKGNKIINPVILDNSNVKNVITLSGINLKDYKAGEIKIFDATGRNYAATVQSSNTVTVNTLTNGVYYLKIKDLPALNFIAR